MIYLVTGGAVWWMRPDRAGAWALLLFCSTMSVQLATVIQSDYIAWSFPRLMVNLPLIGATTFHLFTSYPIEPDWIVRHRRIQVLPYLAAVVLGWFAIADHMLGMRAGIGSSLALAYTLGLFVVSLAVVGIERHRHREGALRDHADVVFLGAVVSFLPAVIGLVAELLFRDLVPVLPAAALGLRVPARGRLRDRAASSSSRSAPRRGRRSPTAPRRSRITGALRVRSSPSRTRSSRASA